MTQTEPKTSGWQADWPWLLVLTGLGLWVRLQYMGQDLHYDEAFTYLHYAAKPLSVALSHYDFPNNHLLHTAQVHLATRLLGDVPWVIRLPALLAGLLQIPLTYALGMALYRRSVGLLAAAGVAGWPQLVAYSANARGYALVVDCFLLLCLLVATWPALAKARARWLTFGAVAVVGLYTIPVMLYPLAVVAIWWLWGSPAGRRFEVLRGLCWTGLGVGLATGLLYWPVVAYSGWAALTGNLFVRSLPWARFGQDLPLSLIGMALDWMAPFGAGFGAGILLLVLAGLAFHPRWKRPEHPFAPLLLVAPLVLLAMLLLQRVVPPPRVWQFLLPVVALTGSVGLVGLLGRWLTPVRTGVFGVLLASGLTGGLLIRQPPAYELQAIVAQLGQQPERPVMLLVPGNRLPAVQYYLQRQGQPHRLLFENWQLSLLRLGAYPAPPQAMLLLAPQPLPETLVEESSRRLHADISLKALMHGEQLTLYQVNPLVAGLPDQAGGE